MSVARRYLYGSLYLGAGAWTTNALNFVVTLAVARLLGPEIMGFYAFVFAIGELINLIGAFAIDLALLQAREESDAQYDTALALSALLGLTAVATAAVVGAVLAARGAALAGWFVVVLGAVQLLVFLGRVPMAKLERHARFRAVAGINMATSNVPNLLSLALAWLGGGAWSLLAREVASGVGAVVLPFTISGLRFRWRLDRAAASRLVDFARPMVLARGLEVAMTRADRLLIGPAFGTTTLGLWSQARTLAESALIAARPIHRLSFTLFARLQDHPQRLARAYAVVNYLMVRLVCAGVVTLLVFPEDTVRLLLGERWLPAAPILRWLAPYAGLAPVLEGMKQLLYGRGAVRDNVRLRLVQLAVYAPGLALGCRIDRLDVVAIFLVAATAVGIALAVRYNRALVAPQLGRLWVVPVAAVLATCGLFALPPVATATAALPFWCRPFLAAPVYALLVLACEPRRLAAEARFLRAAARGGAA